MRVFERSTTSTFSTENLVICFLIFILLLLKINNKEKVVENETNEAVAPDTASEPIISGLQEPKEDCLNREDFAKVFTNYITNLDSAVWALNSP